MKTKSRSATRFTAPSTSPLHVQSCVVTFVVVGFVDDVKVVPTVGVVPPKVDAFSTGPSSWTRDDDGGDQRSTSRT